ncbi:hypothetical protein AB0E08_07540 [Streptomyces sp. NPDC048281]|uniref:hypothetical protein n=1 Tax=Streptomyces sp. NPDC048281 TaxID=3154715 RepID=UPI00343D1B26
MTSPSGDKPVYYRLNTDRCISDILDGFNEEETVHFVTDKVVDPYDTGSEDSWYAEHAARATPEEHTAWTGAYQTFTGAVSRADDDLKAAQAAWEAAQARHSAALQDAWNDYAPTDAVIYERQDEVVTMRRQREDDERAAQTRAAQQAQDQEDAELGARTWVTFTPLYNHGMKVKPDMMVPVIHLAGCKITKGSERLPYTNEYRYARKAEVQETLLEGAFRRERGRTTSEKLPTKLCGRCKPHESLRKALGYVYDEWLEGVESIQDPMPTPDGTPNALGLKDEWRSRSKDGFTTVSSTYYRDEGLIEPYETLVGWYDAERRIVWDAPEKLAELEQLLPERGFAVRRVKEPKAFNVGDKLSQTGVAVRRMTKAEIRRRKEAAANPAPIQNLEG